MPNIYNGNIDTSESPLIDANIFSSINEIEKSNKDVSREAISWLRRNAKTVLNTHQNIVENTGTKLPDNMNKNFTSMRADKRSIGRIFMFAYDPKLKAKLPYYDTLPLIILVDFTKDGFRGLNLHYLPPFVRKKVLELLVNNLNRYKLNERMRVRMSYDILKRALEYAIVKHAFKRYLFTHVRSVFMYIDPNEWNKAIMLPTEQFKKATKNKVWSDYVNSSLRQAKPKSKS